MSRPKTHPNDAPAWCEIAHKRGARIHSASIGEVVLADDECVSVELNDFGDGNGETITLYHHYIGLPANHQTLGAAMNADQSRHLAALLATASDALEDRPHVAARHTFAVSPTPGGHHVWHCACGYVLVQDPRDTDTTAALLAHATGASR